MKKPIGSLLLSLMLLPLGLTLLASAYPDEPGAETATVYILRPAKPFGDINPKFRLSTNMGHELSIQEGTLHKLEVYEPGELRLESKYWVAGEDQYRLQVEAGKTYYMVITLRVEGLVENPVLLEVTESHFEIEKQKLIEQGIAIE